MYSPCLLVNRAKDWIGNKDWKSLLKAGWLRVRRALQRGTHMQFIEQHSIRGAVGSWLCCLPELLLRRVAVHGTQLEQAI